MSNWHGVVFIIVRTFPFWAIPLAIMLFASIPRIKAKSKKGKLIKFGLILLAIILLIGSGAYLMFQGHKDAVPFLYQLLNPGKAL